MSRSGGPPVDRVSQLNGESDLPVLPLASPPCHVQVAVFYEWQLPA